MTELVKRKELPELTEEYKIVEMEKEKAKAEILERRGHWPRNVNP